METAAEGGRTGALPLTVALALAATVLGVVDGLIPRPLPFLRTGLANVVTVMAAVRWGIGKAVAVNLLRSTAVSVFYGTLATPAFLLSLSGGLASALVMGTMSRLVHRWISVTALSAAGGTASITVQLIAAVLILPGIPAGSLLLPLVSWGLLSGIITGGIAVLLMRNGYPERLLSGLVQVSGGG
jgi:heptaprenyl diphosphate synthase